MTLGELMKSVCICGRVTLAELYKDGHIDTKTIGWTDGLKESEEYHMGGGNWVFVSDYEDLEVNAIYTNRNSVTIEMHADE